jgi:hypothetical protein
LDGPLSVFLDGPLSVFLDGPLSVLLDGPLSVFLEGPLSDFLDGPLSIYFCCRSKIQDGLNGNSKWQIMANTQIANLQAVLAQMSLCFLVFHIVIIFNFHLIYKKCN